MDNTKHAEAAAQYAISEVAYLINQIKLSKTLAKKNYYQKKLDKVLPIAKQTISLYEKIRTSDTNTDNKNENTTNDTNTLPTLTL